MGFVILKMNKNSKYYYSLAFTKLKSRPDNQIYASFHHGKRFMKHLLSKTANYYCPVHLKGLIYVQSFTYNWIEKLIAVMIWFTFNPFYCSL